MHHRGVVLCGICFVEDCKDPNSIVVTLSYVRTEGKFDDAVITQGAEKKV